MPTEAMAAYHDSRQVDHQPFRSACYAPYVSLSFDVHGGVSVCSFTRSTPLGRIGDRPLEEMWRSARAEGLRSAVRADDLGRWCGRCAEEIQGGNHHGVLAAGFDRFRAEPERPWPTRMEFALTNECNLRCTMCSGEYSSAIRRRREGLPPLPDRYGGRFLDELEPFLPHLEQARFLGGEPFLAEVNFRIWERMVATGATVECNVTTNGTQWNERIEQVLDHLPFSIGISIDGATRDTVERVREGASHARIMANLERFLEHRDRTGGSVSLTYCLMVGNWHEFADFLTFAEERDCQVFVNTVRQPPSHSLYRLHRAELAAVVDALQARRDDVAARLDRNRAAWTEQLDRLVAHLESLGTDRARPGVDLDDLVTRATEAGPDVAAVRRLLAEASAGGEVDVLRGDGQDRLATGDRYLGVDVAGMAGRPVADLQPVVAARLGHDIAVLAESVAPGVVARVVSMGPAATEPWIVASVVLPGTPPHGTVRLGAVLRAPTGTPVAGPTRPS